MPSFRDWTKIRMVYECDGQQLAIARHAASRCFLHDMTSYLQVRKRRRPSIATVRLRSVGGVKVGCTHPVCLAEWWSRLPNTRSSACSITPSVSGSTALRAGFGERDPAAGKRFCRLILARVSAQVSRDTLSGPKMAGMTAASFLELPGEARAEKIWLPCRVDRRVPGTSVGTDCTVVTADAHSLWRRR